MRLTTALMYYIRRKHIPGKIDIGKHRIMPYINPRVKKAAMTAMVDEQRNLDVLQRTYLTADEEENHLEDMGVTQINEIRAAEEKTASKWLKNRPMEDELLHLNVSKQWE